MLFTGRGRGKPVQNRSCTAFINQPKPGPICISEEKTLSIVYSAKGRGGGTFAQAIIKQTAAADEDSDAKARALVAASTNHLIAKGIFSKPQSTDHPFDNLSDRILLIIFSYVADVRSLTICERVCRRWKNVLTSSISVYERLKKIKVKTMRFEVAKVATLTCQYVKNKTPNNGKIGDFDYYKIVYQIPCVYARNAFVVETASKIFDKFKIIGTSCYVDMSLSDNLLNMLVIKQTSVKQLRFLRCLFVGNALSSLKAIRGIKELAIDHCDGYGDAISSKSILPILQRNVFRSLELSGARVLDNVDDAVMEALLSNWKHDKFDFLKLTNCPNISTNAIARVVKHYVRQSDKTRLIVFLQNTGFNVEKFLLRETSFRRNLARPTTQRVCLENNSVLIWVEN